MFESTSPRLNVVITSSLASFSSFSSTVKFTRFLTQITESLDSISSNEYFDLLQEIGFFDSLNKNLNLMISEYEDEIISVSKIESALKIVEEYKVKFLLYRDLFFEIERLMLLAYEKKTGFLLFF